MFVLVELKDTVRIPPSAFKYKLNDVIAEELNQKLANKVYKDEMERPTQNPEGVHVTLGFFEDIIIPPHKLQHPSRFDQMEQVWVWIYKTEDGETHDLFMDQGEEIRFRVVQEIFTETPLPTESNAPNAPNASTLPSTSRDVDGKPETNNVAPYVLHGSIDESGLGLLSWWQNT